MSEALINEYKLYCANPICEELLTAEITRCTRCQEPQLFCRSCGSTARLLARYCRLCTAPLQTDWAIAHTGLQFHPRAYAPVPTNRLSLSWQFNCDSEMTAAPLAARGIVVLTQCNGRIILIDETDARIRTQLQVTPPISFTPVLIDNLLVVAAGDSMVAVDLIAALYGGMAKRELIAWQLPLATPALVTRPLLANAGTVIATVKQSTQSQVLIIDSESGQIRATVALEGRSGKTTAPYLKEKDLFIANRDGTIMLIDVARAQVRAKVHSGREIDTDVLPCGRANSVYFVLADGQLCSASLAELQLQSFGDTGGLIINALAATEKHVAVAHGSGLALYDPFGALLWETALDANSIVTVPLIENDHAWVIDDSGMMFFFSLLVSVPRLRQRIFEHAVALPAILTDDQLIFSSTAGQVKAYRWR
ncbi:MAG: PQQ-binding-like beta-propeller repeat protein [Acidobacteriota bacterium]